MIKEIIQPVDREAGFEHALSVWQMEVSLTQVLDRPLAGRQFFEEVIRDNLDLMRAKTSLTKRSQPL